MTDKTPAKPTEKSDREKELDVREAAIAAREAALVAPSADEDLTPSPTQAENDAAKMAVGGHSAEYKNRAVKAD